MSITLKEFAQFMIDFVNKNFTPLLQTGNQEHQKCLEHWRRVSDTISDIQKINYWNLEALLKNIGTSTPSRDSKDGKEYKKIDNSLSSAINYKTYDNFFDRKESLLATYNLQDPPKVNSSLKATANDFSESKNKSFKYSNALDTFDEKSSFENKNSNQKTEALADPEGFQRLIQSFRKLCSNFEINHKKLLREDQSFKQNLKEEFAHH